MKIKVMYCGYIRKGGTSNTVIFDTEKKIYTGDKDLFGDYVFVEAHMSRDVDALREFLIKNGYTKVTDFV